MAAANKCDRCGAYYDEPEIGSKNIIGVRLVNDWMNCGKRYDLCEDCVEELCKFMRIKRE